jgi:aryl-alcohol dehydrogenase-like predicted oxidoreductase
LDPLTGPGAGYNPNVNDYTHREVPRLGRRLFRLGLSGSFDLDEAGCREALERVQYVFWSPRMKALTPALRDALARDRDRYVVSAGPLLGYFPGAVRRAAEAALRTLGIDSLDVFQLYWLGKMSAFTGSVREEMRRLRKEGKVRALGVSIHDRPRAGHLAEESILDLLMIRYNAAHPGAEVEIFPHLARRRPAVVAYTATAWRKLLRAPGGWKGTVPTAGDCYRFCLASPYVDVVLTGPRTVAELRENLAAVDRGPLSPAEMEEMRVFGRAVHG